MAASPGPAGVGGAGAVYGSGPLGFALDSGLEIKTRSVEQTLLPLVSQVKWRPALPLFSLPPRPAMAAAARTTGREAVAAPLSAPALRRCCPTACVGLRDGPRPGWRETGQSKLRRQG